MLSYFKLIADAFSTVQFYPAALQWSWRKLIGFWLVSVTLLGWAWGGWLATRVIPELQNALIESAQSVATTYPDVRVKWDGQQLLWAPTQPLTVNHPQLGAVATFIAQTTLNLPQPPGEFATPLVVSTDTLFMRAENGQWHPYPLANLLTTTPPFEATATDLPQLAQQIRQFTPYLQILSAMIAPMGLLISRVWVGFIDGLLVYVILFINGWRWKFSRVFRLSLLITIPATAVWVASLYLYKNHYLPLFSLVYWAMTIVLLLTQRRALSAKST